MENLSNILENLKNKVFCLFKQFLVIFLYYVLLISLQLFFKNHLFSDNMILVNTCYIFIELIAFIIFIFIFRKNIVPDLDDFKKNYKKYIKDNFKYWLIGLCVMLISNLIISSYIGLPANEEANRDILFRLPAYSLSAMLIMGPIIEELMTRVLLKNDFKNKWVYIGLSGLIFGSLHLLSITTLPELLFIIPYSALGCSFAYMYYKTDNIWTSIFFHFLHNLISILLIFAGV